MDCQCTRIWGGNGEVDRKTLFGEFQSVWELGVRLGVVVWVL